MCSLTLAMKHINSITISVFIKEDNAEDIKNTFLSLIPFSLEEEKIQLKESTSTGLTNNTITVLEVKLEKTRHTKAFITNLKQNLGQEQINLLREQENRLDENCNFFLRLDKQDLLHSKYTLTDEGNCFHIKMSMAAFPKKRENALKVVKEIFS